MAGREDAAAGWLSYEARVASVLVRTVLIFMPGLKVRGAFQRVAEAVLFGSLVQLSW